MTHAAGLAIAAWVVLSDRYHVHPGQTRSVTASCMRISSMVSIGGMLLEKFYNRGWVDYVLLVLTPHGVTGR